MSIMIPVEDLLPSPVEELRMSVLSNSIYDGLGDCVAIKSWVVGIVDWIRPELRPVVDMKASLLIQDEIAHFRDRLYDAFFLLWSVRYGLDDDLRVITQGQELTELVIFTIRKLAIAEMFMSLERLQLDESRALLRANIFARFLMDEVKRGANQMYQCYPELLLLRAKCVTSISMSFWNWGVDLLWERAH